MIDHTLSELPKTVLFFTTAVVEIDNFLPIFEIMKRRSDKFRPIIVSLDYGKSYVETPFIRSIVDPDDIHSIFEFIEITPMRILLTQLSRLASRLHDRKIKNGEKLLERYSAKFIRFLMRRFIDILPNGCCNKKLEEYDLWILSPGIMSSFKTHTVPVFAGLISAHSGLYRKIVFFPETFDQFINRKEFSDLPNLSSWNQTRLVLSRGDISSRIELVESIPVLDIGSPRYSKYWCERIHSFSSSSRRFSSHNSIVLYLPIKASPPEPWMVEEVERLDKELFSLLNLYDNIQIVIKPHPRTVDAYKNVSRFTDHLDRVTVVPENVDTASISASCSLCISGGTSFIPHLLWLNIPVVLSAGWAERQDLVFLYDKCCFKWNDLPKLIEILQKKTNIPRKCSHRQLNQWFECGIPSDDYQRYLEQKILKIG